MSKKNIQTLKGFRDFYPEDKAFQSWFYQNAKFVSELFGFQEYDGPILEPLELYAAKSGEELVQKQAFTFEDKGGRTVALRPEMTPTLAKMIAAKSGELKLPVRWFNYGSRFRYEQPQKGRGREFFQWDIDIVGSKSLLADAEVIAVAASFYKKIGFTPDEVIIKINDRELLNETFKKIGIPNSNINKMTKLIDKKDKIGNVEYEKGLKELGLNKSQTKKLQEFLKDKKGYLESQRLVGIFSMLEKYDLSKFVEYDPQIVRGLDYYTSTVFECWDTKGKLRALWGGGRYDNLVENVGSKKKIPGVGFAMGDMVLYELLKEIKKLPVSRKSPARALITVFSEKELSSSINTLNLLRNANIPAEIYLKSKDSLQKQLKYADKKGVSYAVIIGPEEIIKNEVILKNLKTKKQESIPQIALPTRIK